MNICFDNEFFNSIWLHRPVMFISSSKNYSSSSSMKNTESPSSSSIASDCSMHAPFTHHLYSSTILSHIFLTVDLGIDDKVFTMASFPDLLLKFSSRVGHWDFIFFLSTPNINSIFLRVLAGNWTGSASTHALNLISVLLVPSDVKRSCLALQRVLLLYQLQIAW